MLGNGTDQIEQHVHELIQGHRPGWTLDQAFFSDPAVFELELERIVLRNWLFAGHESRIPNRGDYFLYELAGESLIIIRADEHQVHVLVNVCRHRGSRVCVEAAGHAHMLVCPYHQWVYNVDGTLHQARLMPADFDKSQANLQRAHVRVVAGLIFFCLAENPPDLEPVLRDILPHLEPYDLAQARICYTWDYDLHANWKVLSENFRECYHCGGNHPELCRLMPHIAVESPKVLAEFERWVTASQARWKDCGLATHNVPVSADRLYHVMRFPFKKGFVSQTMNGQPVAPPMGRLRDPDAGVVAGSILPTFWFEFSGDHGLLMRLTPAGTQLTQVRVDWMVRGDAVEGVDYELDRVTAFWRVTLEQDWTLCTNTQAGINSRFYKPGPFAPGITANSSLGERGPRAFTEWYLRQLTLTEPRTSP